MASSHEINLTVNASLRVIYDLKVSPLKLRSLRALSSQAEKFAAMAEADRVVKALHQVRANLRSAMQALREMADDDRAQKELTRLVAATQGILKGLAK
jgi:hypothetical protein